MMKKCPKCQEIKEHECFYIQKSGRYKDKLSCWCKNCCKKQASNRWKNDKEKCLEEHRKWVNNNKERVAFHKAKSTYGITEEEYKSLKRVCTICGSIKNLRIDHSHQTGKVRGMLCDSCNKGLGFFKDNPMLLDRASNYIIGEAKPDVFEKTYELIEQ